MSRILSWLSTKNGRRLTQFCVGGAALFVFGNHIAIRGPMLDKVIDVFQVYKFGKPKPLTDKVNLLIDKVLKDSKLKEEEKKKLKFFYIVGQDLFHFGGTNSPWGAVVGIPFTFEDIKDINFGEIRISGREVVDWVIDGHDLIESLRLSENAKKFALLREIYSCNFSEVLENATLGAFCVLIPARFAQMMNIRTNAFERLSLRQRNIRYALFFAFGFLFYRLLKDPLKHMSDEKSDRLAAETGPEYLIGGIEYYQKTIMRNKALQDLAKSNFWNKYDDKGNEKYILLAPRLPLSKRLANLQKMKQESTTKVDYGTSE